MTRRTHQRRTGGVAGTKGDKVEAERRFGVSVNTYGVNDLVSVVDAITDAEVDALTAEYDDTYTVAESLRPGGAGRTSLRDAARIELGIRQFCGTADSARSPPTSRILAAFGSSRASPCSA